MTSRWLWVMMWVVWGQVHAVPEVRWEPQVRVLDDASSVGSGTARELRPFVRAIQLVCAASLGGMPRVVSHPSDHHMLFHNGDRVRVSRAVPSVGRQAVYRVRGAVAQHPDAHTASACRRVQLDQVGWLHSRDQGATWTVAGSIRAIRAGDVLQPDPDLRLPMRLMWHPIEVPFSSYVAALWGGEAAEADQVAWIPRGSDDPLAPGDVLRVYARSDLVSQHAQHAEEPVAQAWVFAVRPDHVLAWMWRPRALLHAGDRVSDGLDA